MNEHPKKRRLLVYCDESADKGQFYSHFYGGAAVDERKHDRITQELAATCAALNMQGEVKWTKIGDGHVDRYCALMDKLFEFISNREIKVRVMFMQNIYEAKDLEEYHLDNQYFLLYYQFIKHAFGFQFCNPNRDADTQIVLLFDKLPESPNKCSIMKDYLAGLGDFPPFRELYT